MSKPPKERTKVVVRNLPPGLTEDAFRAVVDKHHEGKYDWWSYYAGKIRCAAAAQQPAICSGPRAPSIPGSVSLPCCLAPRPDRQLVTGVLL